MFSMIFVWIWSRPRQPLRSQYSSKDANSGSFRRHLAPRFLGLSPTFVFGPGFLIFIFLICDLPSEPGCFGDGSPRVFLPSESVLSASPESWNGTVSHCHIQHHDQTLILFTNLRAGVSSNGTSQPSFRLKRLTKPMFPHPVRWCFSCFRLWI